MRDLPNVNITVDTMTRPINGGKVDLGIAGKRALVTGGGRGIGKAVALALAEEGARVAVASRTESDIDATSAALGDGHLGVPIDLMPPDAPIELIARVEQELGPIDILINNVGGTLGITDPECPIEDWQKVWRFNFEIAVQLNALVLPQMRSQEWGRIVHVSSISGAENHGPVPYCSAKAAINAYTRSMGRIVAPDGIAMSSVLPGAIFTEGGYWDDASKNRPDHVKRYLDERMASHRFGTLDEISRMIVFLASDYAGFCVGSVIPVDGGQGRTFNFGGH